MSSKSQDDQITQTIASLRKIAAETEATSESANSTIIKQGEEISRFHIDAERIDANLKISERIIGGLTSFTGRLKGWFNEPSKASSSVTQSQGYSSAPRHSPTPTGSAPSNLSNQFTPTSSEPPFQTPTQTSSSLLTSSEDSMLDEISMSLQRMKANALSTSDSFKSQNIILNQTSEMVDRSNDRVSKNERAIKNLR